MINSLWRSNPSAKEVEHLWAEHVREQGLEELNAILNKLERCERWGVIGKHAGSLVAAAGILVGLVKNRKVGFSTGLLGGALGLTGHLLQEYSQGYTLWSDSKTWSAARIYGIDINYMKSLVGLRDALASAKKEKEEPAIALQMS